MVGRPQAVATVDDVAELEALARSARRDEADRARAVLLSVHGWTSGQIARAFGSIIATASTIRWTMSPSGSQSIMSAGSKKA